MDSNNEFEQNIARVTNFKKICRLYINNFINDKKFEFINNVALTFCIKSLDLTDGIIKLYELNLEECAQALIRVLFETNLKFIHFMHIFANNGIQSASKIVMDSAMILRQKAASQQDKVSNTNELTSILNINELPKYYTNEEIKNIEKFGFPQMSLIALTEKYNKKMEYEFMYRSFSRNVHANDTIEYLQRLGVQENVNHGARNDAAIDLTFKSLYEIMFGVEVLFHVGLDNVLNNYKNFL